MKLLRLLSVNETESDYIAQFQEPIDIQPNSKIALQQISFNLEPQFVSVTNDNNTFYLLSSRYVGVLAPFGRCVIPNGNYNLEDLTNAIRLGLNSGLLDPREDASFLISQTTMETTAYIDSDNLMNIEYAISPIVQNEDINVSAGIVNDEETPPHFLKDANYSSEWACGYSNLPFSLGQGYLETIIDASGEEYDINGCCIGVFPLTTAILEPNPNVSPISYKFCMYSFDDVYYVSENLFNNITPLQINTGVGVLDGDRISMSQGRYEEDAVFLSGVRFFVERSNGDGTYQDPELIYSFTYDFTLVLHAGFSLTGDCRIKGFTFSPTAFANKTEQGVSIVNKVADIDAHNYLRFNNGQIGASPTDSYILRFTAGSQALLGFPKLSTTTQTGLTANWKGNLNMYNLAIPSALVVEMPNLPLLSYDSYLHRRRPILAIIPSKDLEVNNETITYTPNYPVFIGINNKYQELLNAIRVRVVSTNNLPLKIKALYGCDLSVLIE